jgi:hypothetical protein
MGERRVHGNSAAHSAVFDAKDGSTICPFWESNGGVPVRRAGVWRCNPPKIIPNADEQVLCVGNSQVRFGFGDELGGGPAPYRHPIRFFMGKCRQDSFP